MEKLSLVLKYAQDIGNYRSCPFVREGGKLDYHIGPCTTLPAERGKGYYPMLLHAITSDLGKENNYYMIVEENNLPSLRGIAKAGFTRVGVGIKNKWGQYIIINKD